MKQTAVEWLINELIKRGYQFEKKENIIIDQAKEMEKEQIKEIYLNGFKDGKEFQNKSK